MNYKRIFIEKKSEYNSEKESLLKEFRNYLKIESLKDVRYVNVYDLVNISDDDYEYVKENILVDKNIDCFYQDELPIDQGDKYFRVEFVKGQFNNREDGLEELIRTTTLKDGVRVKNSKVLIFKGIDEKSFEKIKSYYINPVELKELGLDDFSFQVEKKGSTDIEVLENFIAMSETELENLRDKKSIGLDIEDLLHIQGYFKKEDRNPTITEIKLIDTYWSDHCRHTTFMTELVDIEFEGGKYSDLVKNAFEEYLRSRKYVYGDRKKPICLMDIATMNTRELKKKGLLDDLEESEEVNAASIEIDIEVDGRKEGWLLMFKNETHNHPTEIEPFGGASTCLGGAIRDPLSGRSYVYQAMRITGAKNPLEDFEDRLDGKLAQRKISQDAMKGYSSYGNEIGVPAGYVREIYDEGYVAKRMEVGALVAAAPKESVRRESPTNGDIVVLVGGRTGKDGLGGAVGSSKGHTEESLEEGGAEVQKGNPKLERKIMRLFRKSKVSKMIKSCNDFGAGGVSVAIGELADGIDIELEKVPVKYKGMNPTEIALSESQERMAVVIEEKDREDFLRECREEDVEATVVANITDTNRLRISYEDRMVVDIDRSFLDTNGIRKRAEVLVEEVEDLNFFKTNPKHIAGKSVREDWLNNVKDLNIASQKGLIEKFDHTVGKGTVLMPLGGKNRISQAEGMVARIPVLQGYTKDVSMMSFGFDPSIGRWSSFHGGMYSVIESIAKIVALGGDYSKIRFSFQEYFERLGEDRSKWGKPFAALLGAFLVDKELDLPSIGGKDSMSGSFEDINVPGTLISFAVNHDKVDNILSPEFKRNSSRVVLVDNKIDERGIVDFEDMKKNYSQIKTLVDKGRILSASSVKYGGISRSITEMALGNSIGFEFTNKNIDLFTPKYGSIILEVEDDIDLEGLAYVELGHTLDKEEIVYGEDRIGLDEIFENYSKVFEGLFPVGNRVKSEKILVNPLELVENKAKTDRVKVLIPVFTGTHGEYDMARSFEDAGAEVEFFVFKSSDKNAIEDSYRDLSQKISKSNILALSDGMVVGGEPEGKGKLLKNILRESQVKEAVNDLVKNRKGLVLGIGEGLSALLGSGLLPYGEVVEDRELISLSRNTDNIHKSTIENYRLLDNTSPWFLDKDLDRAYIIPVSTAESRFVVPDSIKDRLNIVGQFEYSKSGDNLGIESLTDKSGRILGRLGNSERMDKDLFKNIDGHKEDSIFENAVNYFKGK